MCFLKLKENSFFGGVNSTYFKMHGANIKIEKKSRILMEFFFSAEKRQVSVTFVFSAGFFFLFYGSFQTDARNKEQAACLLAVEIRDLPVAC